MLLPHCTLHFLFFFNNCIVPKEFLLWEIRVAFPRESQLRQSHATQPIVHAGCLSVSIIRRTLTWTTDYGIFTVHTDVNVCHCTWACTDTVRKSALKVDPGRKIPRRTRQLNLCRQHAGPMLYQLGYIPTKPGWSYFWHMASMHLNMLHMEWQLLGFWLTVMLEWIKRYSLQFYFSFGQNTKMYFLKGR